MVSDGASRPADDVPRVQVVTELGEEDREFVRRAAQYLEHPPLLLRIANTAGLPIERLLARLPARTQAMVQRAVQRSLQKALAVALETIPTQPHAPGHGVRAIDAKGRRHRTLHQVAATVSGAVGGFFGLAGMAVELPVTTTLMLRAIAQTASDFGEDLEDPLARLECLSVFSLGGPGTGDDAMDSTYYAARASMALMLGRVAEFAATRTAAEITEALSRGSAPVLARLIASIAARFDVVVTGKVIAEAVPVLGAGSGALINGLFMEHFCDVARYHFGLRRLERVYGLDAVRAAFEQ